MTKRTTTIIKRPETREIIIERLLPASPELVWQTWTQPEHIGQWFGPKHWTAIVHEMDVRPGGIWRYSLRANDGSGTAFCKATYQEVNRPSRLFFIDSFTDATWQTVTGNETATTVTLDKASEGTKLTIITQFADLVDLKKAEAMGMIEGFTETLDRLDEYVTTTV